jgi:hypothetical protein
MLYSEIIAVCSEIHTKHNNALCGHKDKNFFFILNLLVHKATTKLERVKDFVSRITYWGDSVHDHSWCTCKLDSIQISEELLIQNSRLVTALLS